MGNKAGGDSKGSRRSSEANLKGGRLSLSKGKKHNANEPPVVDAPAPVEEASDSTSEGPLDLLEGIPAPVWPDAPVFPETLEELTLVKELEGREAFCSNLQVRV
jgi:hypothetical protein